MKGIKGLMVSAAPLAEKSDGLGFKDRQSLGAAGLMVKCWLQWK